MPDGAERIAAERARQVAEEGWTAEHDLTEHTNGELAWAAACYAAPHRIYREPERTARTISFADPWPWDWRYDKRRWNANYPYQPGYPWPEPDNRIRMLERAGALIAAEIDRLLVVEAEQAKRAAAVGLWNEHYAQCATCLEGAEAATMGVEEQYCGTGMALKAAAMVATEEPGS